MQMLRIAAAMMEQRIATGVLNGWGDAGGGCQPFSGAADAGEPLVHEDAEPKSFEDKRGDGCDEDRYPVESNVAHPALR